MGTLFTYYLPNGARTPYRRILSKQLFSFKPAKSSIETQMCRQFAHWRFLPKRIYYDPLETHLITWELLLLRTEAILSCEATPCVPTNLEQKLTTNKTNTTVKFCYGAVHCIGKKEEKRRGIHPSLYYLVAEISTCHGTFLEC